MVQAPGRNRVGPSRRGRGATVPNIRNVTQVSASAVRDPGLERVKAEDFGGATGEALEGFGAALGRAGQTAADISKKLKEKEEKEREKREKEGKEKKEKEEEPEQEPEQEPEEEAAARQSLAQASFKIVRQHGQVAEDLAARAAVATRSAVGYQEAVLALNQEMSPSDSGYEEALNARFETVKTTVVDQTLKEYSPTEAARAELLGVAEARQLPFRTRADINIHNARLMRTSATVEESLGALAAQVQQDPKFALQARLAMDEQIKTLEAVLPPERAAEAEVEADRRLGFAEIDGLTERDPQVALELLSSDHFKSFGLTDEEILQARERVQAAVARRELEQQRNEEIARRGVRITLADDRLLSSQTAEERDEFRQRALALLPEEEAAQAIVRLDAKTKAEELALPFVVQTPEEIAASIDALVPGDPGEASADRLALVQELRAMAAETLRARAEDPAEYAMRLPAVQDAFDGVQEDGQGLAAAIDTGLASQETIAIPKNLQRALPRARARAMVADLQATPVEELPAKFRALEEQAGKHSPRVQSELFEAGLDPRYQLLALRADDPAAGLLARAIQSDPAELRKDIEPATIRTIESAVQDELGHMRSLMRVADPKDERGAMFDTLRDIIDKFAATTPGIVDSIGRFAPRVALKQAKPRNGPTTTGTNETAVRDELATGGVPLRAQTEVADPSDRHAKTALHDIVTKYSTLEDVAFILYRDRGRTDERAARDAAAEAADLLLRAYDFAGGVFMRKRIGGQAVDRNKVDAAVADTLQPSRIKEFGPLPKGRVRPGG